MNSWLAGDAGTLALLATLGLLVACYIKGKQLGIPFSLWYTDTKNDELQPK